MPELSEPPEGYQSVKGIKSSEEQPSFFKVSDLHILSRVCDLTIFFSLFFHVPRLMSMWCTHLINSE